MCPQAWMLLISPSFTCFPLSLCVSVSLELLHHPWIDQSSAHRSLKVRGDICQPTQASVLCILLHTSYWQAFGHEGCMNDSLTFFVCVCISICLCVGVCMRFFGKHTRTHTGTEMHLSEQERRVKREIDFSKKSRHPHQLNA